MTLHMSQTLDHFEPHRLWRHLMTIARTLGLGLLLLAAGTSRANTAFPDVNLDFDALELTIDLVNETPFPLQLVRHHWQMEESRQQLTHSAPTEFGDPFENWIIAPGARVTDAIAIGIRNLEPDHRLTGEFSFLVEGTDEAFDVRYELVPPHGCRADVTALDTRTRQKYPLLYICGQNSCQLHENSDFSGRLGHRITKFHHSTLTLAMEEPAIACIKDSACNQESFAKIRTRECARTPDKKPHHHSEL